MALAAVNVIWSEGSWIIGPISVPAALLVLRHKTHLCAPDGSSLVLPLSQPQESIWSGAEAAAALGTARLILPASSRTLEAGVWPFCSRSGLVPLRLRTVDTNQWCSRVDVIM